MDRSLKRFARRIILVHLVLLLGVLGLVIGASHAVYKLAHNQAQAQSLTQMNLLANLASNGLQDYYNGIFSDLELFKPVDPDSEDTEERTLADGPIEFNPQPFQPRPPIGRRRGNLPPQIHTLEAALPFQLSGRVSNLFLYRQDEILRTLITPTTKPSSQDVVESARAFLDQPIARPAVLSFVAFDIPKTGSRGFSVVRVPIQGASQDSLLVAAIPVRTTAKQFLDEVNRLGQTFAFLLDEKMMVMAASAGDKAGGNAAGGQIDAKISKAISQLAPDGTDGGVAVFDDAFTVGTQKLDPSIIAVQKIRILDDTRPGTGQHWYVLVATPLTEVDGVVGPLFKRTLFWAIFVALSMTAILLSTAIQLIRSRVRAERERHAILEKEVRQARDIQLHWLPRPRANDGILDIATINQPASRISGDFYNWFELPDGRTAVVIGDVTGHGMAAAFLMATTQLLVRNTLPITEDPGRCLEEINRQLCTQVFNGQFVTIQILALDPMTGRVEIATAGHPVPLMGAGESFKRLRLEPNLVLGVDKTANYPTEVFQLAPLATLLLYTDGVVDVESATGTRFGTERLQQSLYGQSGGAEQAIQSVLKQVDAFRGKIPLGDDLTMVAIQLQQTFATKHPEMPTTETLRHGGALNG